MLQDASIMGQSSIWYFSGLNCVELLKATTMYQVLLWDLPVSAIASLASIYFAPGICQKKKDLPNWVTDILILDTLYELFTILSFVQF